MEYHAPSIWFLPLMLSLPVRAVEDRSYTLRQEEAIPRYMTADKDYTRNTITKEPKKDVVNRRVFDSPNAFVGRPGSSRSDPDPLGELEPSAPPDRPIVAVGGERESGGENKKGGGKRGDCLLFI